MSKEQISHNSFTAAESLRFALAYEENAAAYAVALTEAAGGQTWREPIFHTHDLPVRPFDQRRVLAALQSGKLQRADRDDPGDCPTGAEKGPVPPGSGSPTSRPDAAVGPDGGTQIGHSKIHGGPTDSQLVPMLSRAPQPDEPLGAQPDEPVGLRIYPVDDYGMLSYKTHPSLGAIQSAKETLPGAGVPKAGRNPRRHWMFLAELEGKIIASVGLFLHQDSVSGYDLLVPPRIPPPRGRFSHAAPDRILYQRAGGIAGRAGFQRNGGRNSTRDWALPRSGNFQSTLSSPKLESIEQGAGYGDELP